MKIKLADGTEAEVDRAVVLDAFSDDELLEACNERDILPEPYPDTNEMIDQLTGRGFEVREASDFDSQAALVNAAERAITADTPKEFRDLLFHVHGRIIA